MFLIMSTRKSSRIGGEATRENGWGNRSRDQNGGRSGDEGARVPRRAVRDVPTFVIQTKLSSTPFWRNTGSLCVKGRKINSSIHLF